MDRHEDPAPTRGQPRLLDQVRGVIRRLHYSIRTEQGYVDGVRRFMLFHGKRRPADRGAVEVKALLTFIAVAGNVPSSTQNHAPNAIVFLYRQIAREESGRLRDIGHAKEPANRSLLFKRDEERAVLARLDGLRSVMAIRLYGRVAAHGGCRRRVRGHRFGSRPPPAIPVSTSSSLVTRTYLKIKPVSDMLYNWEHVTSER